MKSFLVVILCRSWTDGVDRLQAECVMWGWDLVKEIGQTCNWSATIRVHVTSREHLG
jgi:hypothetical protein